MEAQPQQGLCFTKGLSDPEADLDLQLLLLSNQISGSLPVWAGEWDGGLGLA